MTEQEHLQIFQQWLQQYKPLVFRIVRAYGETAMDRDDLFQEISIQVWRSVRAFREISSAKTWIYRVALNTAIKWAQKESKHADSEPFDQLPLMLQLSTTQPDERLAWLYEEIYRLDVIDRSLALLLLDGFKYREMAEILGITESNVGVKINRIKKQLISKSKNIL